MNRALLVGINAYPVNPMPSCINDIWDMAHFLVETRRFRRDNVRLLGDLRATKAAIMDRLDWLLTGLRKGDRILFHFSGHGYALPSRNLQGEVDRVHDVICPVDFKFSQDDNEITDEDNAISDTDFQEIFRFVPEGVELMWISDCCHSGHLKTRKKSRPITTQESRWKCIMSPIDIQWRMETALEKKIRALGLSGAASKPNIVLIAACQSDDNAEYIDTDRPNGVLTRYLIDELKTQNGLKKPLSEVVENVKESIRKAGYSQVPQFVASQERQKRPFLI